MKTWLKVLLILFFAGLIAAFLGYKFIYNKPHADISKAEKLLGYQPRFDFKKGLEITVEYFKEIYK